MVSSRECIRVKIKIFSKHVLSLFIYLLDIGLDGRIGPDSE